jgi:hypothetical protein
MSKAQHASSQVSYLIFAGIFLLGIAFFVPGVGQQQGSFFKMAFASPWDHLFDLPAAWSSGKIILASIGLFCVIEATGTILVRLKRQNLAVAVYLLNIVSAIGFLIGLYCLVKALL